MGSAPVPGAAHDAFEISVPGLPVQLTFDFFRTCDEHCGVTGSARRFLRGNCSSGDFPNCIDYFAHAKTPSIAEVVDQLFVVFQGFENQQVCSGKIADVNVVANAGSIRGGIISSKNCYVLADSQGNLQCDGNQMRLRLMIFALISGSACGIEVAQAAVAQAVNALQPLKHLLDRSEEHT